MQLCFVVIHPVAVTPVTGSSYPWYMMYSFYFSLVSVEHIKGCALLEITIVHTFLSR